MHWIVGSILSAFFLGLYELFKKHAVHHNAVFPVLFFSTLSATLLWLPFMIVGHAAPGVLPAALTVSPLTFVQHLQLFAKSALVALSWIFSYFALKHLPLSIGSPIRSTGPLWTLLGARFVFSEQPDAIQWLGIVITLGAFFALSLAGREEGVVFHRNRWVGYMLAGTALGGASSLYDKYLMTTARFTTPTVQAWFFVYLSVIFLPLMIGWKRRWWQRGEFGWRWTIPLIGLSLLVADYVYFSALRDPQALVAVVACLRRGDVLVSFSGGLLFFHEPNGLRKLPAVIGVIVGICIIVLG